MASYVGGQDLGNRRLVSWRILRDALQGVDAAQRDVDLALVIAELVDRSGEPLGDLALTLKIVLFTAALDVVLQLLPSEVGASGNNNTTKGLKQRRAHVVLELEPSILQLMPLGRIPHVGK